MVHSLLLREGPRDSRSNRGCVANDVDGQSAKHLLVDDTDVARNGFGNPDCTPSVGRNEAWSLPQVSWLAAIRVRWGMNSTNDRASVDAIGRVAISPFWSGRLQSRPTS